MVLLRSSALRGVAPARLYRSAARTVVRPRFQTVARRGYASEGGHEHAAAGSDIPWLISAVAVTLPSCYFLWPEPSHADAHGAHGGEHAEEHEEGEEEASEESKDEPQEEEATPEQPKDDEAPKDDSAPAEEPKEDGAKEEEHKEEEPKEEKPKEDSDDKKQTHEADKSKSQSSKPDTTEPEKVSNQKVDGVQFKGKTAAGDDNNEMQDERKREPDSKGAFKKRIDSAYQKQLGEGPVKDVDGNVTSATSRAFSDDKGAIDKKQQGVSNTPTRHSSDIGQNPEKSKKGEGTPETAKSMGTVSVDRPAR